MVVRNVRLFDTSPVSGGIPVFNRLVTTTAVGTRVTSLVDGLVGTWRLVENHGLDRYLAERKVHWSARQLRLRTGLRQTIARNGDTFSITTHRRGPFQVPQQAVCRLVADGESVVVDPVLGKTLSWLGRGGENTLVTEAEASTGLTMIRRWVEGNQMFHEVTDVGTGMIYTQLFEPVKLSAQRPMSVLFWVTRLRTE